MCKKIETRPKRGSQTITGLGLKRACPRKRNVLTLFPDDYRHRKHCALSSARGLFSEILRFLERHGIRSFLCPASIGYVFHLNLSARSTPLAGTCSSGTWACTNRKISVGTRTQNPLCQSRCPLGRENASQRHRTTILITELLGRRHHRWRQRIHPG